jgi:myosin protein heavy chain
LLKTIDELQISESEAGLAARRAERAAKEEAQKVLRLERELEGLKGLGKGKAGGSFGRSESVWSLSVRDGGVGTGAEENGIEVPRRKSSISRKMSMSKGFL